MLRIFRTSALSHSLVSLLAFSSVVFAHSIAGAATAASLEKITAL